MYSFDSYDNESFCPQFDPTAEPTHRPHNWCADRMQGNAPCLKHSIMGRTLYDDFEGCEKRHLIEFYGK